MSDTTFRNFEANAQSNLNSLKSKLTEISETTTSGQAQPLLVEADQIVRKITQQFRDLDREKSQFDHNTRTALDRKTRTFTKELNELKKTLAEYRQNLNANSLEAAQRADWRMQRQELLEGRVVGEDTTSSLLRTQQTIQSAQIIGTGTVIELERQTEQLEQMNTQLSTMDQVSLKSKAVLRRMQNGIVTSKLLSFFIIFFEVAILGLIIYLKYYS